jgi:arylsulfatase A-like enzyme
MDPGFNAAASLSATRRRPWTSNEGLNLTSAYSTPSCSPSRATIHTGQTPLHHGILRPPMCGEPGGLDRATTLPSIVKEARLCNAGLGKWHMGENRGSLPQNVGYDDYLRFLGVSHEYTEWRDEYFNPEAALSPSRFRMMEEAPFERRPASLVTEAPGSRL